MTKQCTSCGGFCGKVCKRENVAHPEQEPEFFTHNVEQPYDWSEWVCPDPKGYLMKCCDCGLVHQAQFRVAKYEPAPSEECEVVNDPDLQAQFRMRRSEQWSPEDTAHRAGGMPMAQPEQEPVAYPEGDVVGPCICGSWPGGKCLKCPRITTPPQRTWVALTDEEANELWESTDSDWELMKRTEAKLKEKNT